MTPTAATTTTTNKNILKRSIFLIFISLLFAAGLFGYQILPEYSERYLDAYNQRDIKRKVSSKQLKKVKDYAEGTAILKDYKKAKKEYNESKANFNQIQEDEKVFGFKSLRFFCYELGRTLGVLAFILIMFYRLLTKKDESKYIYIICI